jgi:ATP-dependent Clp protease ATP-binding subunit ClpA
MLSKDLEITLSEAFRSARKKHHEFMTVEHLLLALLDNEVASAVLIACACDLSRLRGELVDFVDATTPLIPESEENRETQPTLGFQRVLPERGKSQVRMCCLLYLANRRVKRSILSASRT